MSKVYVDVVAHFDIQGNVTPVAIVWKDGREFIIDKILDRRRAASLKAGGCGTRYTCQIHSQPRFLFYDDREGKWFVEGKE